MSDREPHWYRGYVTSAGFNADDQINVVLPAPAGSTLVRLHYQWIGEERAALPFEDLPQRGVVLGVIARDSQFLEDVPLPIDFPAQQWLHYELLSFTPVMYTIGSPTYALTTFPAGDARRDVKAQRTYETGIQINWVWQSVGVGDAPVFVQLGYEALTLWPEGVHA